MVARETPAPGKGRIKSKKKKKKTNVGREIIYLETTDSSFLYPRNIS
jgi:hypothetical protein